METKEVALQLRQAINSLSAGDDFHPETLNEYMKAFSRAADIIERLARCYEIKPFVWLPHPYFENCMYVRTAVGTYSVTQDGFKYLSVLDDTPISERDHPNEAKEDCFVNFVTKLRPNLNPLRGQVFV